MRCGCLRGVKGCLHLYLQFKTSSKMLYMCFFFTGILVLYDLRDVAMVLVSPCDTTVGVLVSGCIFNLGADQNLLTFVLDISWTRRDAHL